jgi:hypothetical protein
MPLALRAHTNRRRVAVRAAHTARPAHAQRSTSDTLTDHRPSHIQMRRAVYQSKKASWVVSRQSVWFGDWNHDSIAVMIASRQQGIKWYRTSLKLQCVVAGKHTLYEHATAVHGKHIQSSYKCEQRLRAPLHDCAKLSAHYKHDSSSIA